MKRFLKDSNAVTAIEFALIAPLFFLLLIGIVEFGLTMFIQSSLETGIRAFARRGTTQSETYNDFVNIMNANLGGIFDPRKTSLLIYNTATPCAGQADASNFGNLLCIQKNFFADPDGTFDNQAAAGTFDNRKPPTTTVYSAPNTVLLYGVRYDWGGITQLLSHFIPKELYAFTVVRNENYTVTSPVQELP